MFYINKHFLSIISSKILILKVNEFHFKFSPKCINWTCFIKTNSYTIILKLLVIMKTLDYHYIAVCLPLLNMCWLWLYLNKILYLKKKNREEYCVISIIQLVNMMIAYSKILLLAWKFPGSLWQMNVDEVFSFLFCDANHEINSFFFFVFYFVLAIWKTVVILLNMRRDRKFNTP